MVLPQGIDTPAPTQREVALVAASREPLVSSELARAGRLKRGSEQKVSLTLFWGFLDGVSAPVAGLALAAWWKRSALEPRARGLLTAGAAEPEMDEVAAGQGGDSPTKGTRLPTCPLISHPTTGSRGATNMPSSLCPPMGSRLLYDPPCLF